MAKQIDVRIVGNALNTEGFLGFNYALTSLGLMTEGFITECSEIWTLSDTPITTVWIGVPPCPSNIEVCAGNG